ncbi:MAG: NAD-dependent epimerase/dehydratase family protein [Synergistaceae bacterium]|nr:NAD-dependent epimerase/dehydratase family protein [Synergistaceae bacterium]MBQ7169789.1 NAD-dependent epimerase/dehydratase family protein [Synergistaceae bacterium]
MRILITGLHSYTGNAIRQHLSAWPEKYHTDTISLRGDSWRSESFSGFDTVIHTAGIAHDSTRSSLKDDYYRVNTELAFETAYKAMNDGVSQFVFMSSSIVYGKSAPIGQTRVITRDTPVSPESYYGDSKVKAEDMLAGLDGGDFRVCVLRCPMIYGRNCRGNYPVLSRIARTLPFFPNVKNTRSMLYVKNFAEFVRLVAENGERGIFWPQNGEYSCTAEVVRMIAESHGRKILMIPGCEFPLRVLAGVSGTVNKAFGSLAYGMSLSDYREDYRLYSLRESIADTES